MSRFSCTADPCSCQQFNMFVVSSGIISETRRESKDFRLYFQAFICTGRQESMSTKPISALSQIKLFTPPSQTGLWSTVVHIRLVCSWEQVFSVASDESQVVWRLSNMTHILQTNSNTACPVVPSKTIKPLKTWLTCLSTCHGDV